MVSKELQAPRQRVRRASTESSSTQEIILCAERPVLFGKSGVLWSYNNASLRATRITLPFLSFRKGSNSSFSPDWRRRATRTWIGVCASTWRSEGIHRATSSLQRSSPQVFFVSKTASTAHRNKRFDPVAFRHPCDATQTQRQSRIDQRRSRRTVGIRSG